MIKPFSHSAIVLFPFLLCFACAILVGCGDSTDEEAKVKALVDQKKEELRKEEEAAAHKRKPLIEDDGTFVDESSPEKDTPDPKDIGSEDRTDLESVDRDKVTDIDDNKAKDIDTNRGEKQLERNSDDKTLSDKNSQLAKWHQLQRYMKKPEVFKLLGEPTSRTADYSLEYWVYGSGPQAGRLSFMLKRDPRTKKVIALAKHWLWGWREPTW